MSHVYAVDQGLGLQNETVDAVHYDDATSLLLIIKGGVVFAYDLSTSAGGGVWGPEAAPEGAGKVRDRAGTGPRHDQLVWTYPLQEGPGVRAMRCSLDRQMLALCRSLSLVELVDLCTGNISVHTLSGGPPPAPPSPAPKSPMLPLSTSATISPEPRPPSPLSPARLNLTWGRLFGKSRSSKAPPTSTAASHTSSSTGGGVADLRAEGGGVLWGYVIPAPHQLVTPPVGGDGAAQWRTSPLAPSVSGSSPAASTAGASPQGGSPGSLDVAEGGEGASGGSGGAGTKGGYVDRDGVYCSRSSSSSVDGGAQASGGLLGSLIGDYFGAGSSSVPAQKGPSPSPAAWPLSPGSGQTELNHHSNMQTPTAQQQQQQQQLHQSPESAAAAAAAAAGVSVLLGLVFSEAPGAEIVLAGTGGLELCVLAPKKQGIRCSSKIKLGGPITSFTYTHETRCAAALVTPSPAAASALGVSSLPVVQAWQLLPTGLITLPSFTLTSPSLGTAPAASTSLLDDSPPNLLAAEGPRTSQLARPNLLPPEPLTQTPPSPMFNTSLVGPAPSQLGNRQQGVGASGHLQQQQQQQQPHRSVPSDHAWWAGGGGGDSGGWGSGIAAPAAPTAAAGLGNNVSWEELRGLPNPFCVQGASGSAGPLWLLRLYNCVFACHISEHTTMTVASTRNSSDNAAPLSAEGKSRGGDAVAPTPTAVTPAQPHAIPDADADSAETTMTTTVLLRLYRFFTDTVKLQHTYALHTYVHTHGCPYGQQQGVSTSSSSSYGSSCSSSIALSVVDNVLVVQMENARRVVLIDIFADPAQPLTPPMPLTLLQPPRIQAVGSLSALRGAVSYSGASSSSSSSSPTATKTFGTMTPAHGAGTSSLGIIHSHGSAAAVAVAQIVPLEELSSGEDGGARASTNCGAHSAGRAGSGGVDVSRPSWRSYLPNLLVDCSKQGVYRLVLDLHAAAASIPDPAAATAFLLRRRASRVHAQRLQLWPLLSPSSSYLCSAPTTPSSIEVERQRQQEGLSTPRCTIKGGWVVLGGGEGAETRPLDCHGYLTPPKLLVLELVRNLMQDRAPMSVLRRVFAHLCFAFAEVAGPPHTTLKPYTAGSPPTSASPSTAAAAAAGAAAAAAPSTQARQGADSTSIAAIFAQDYASSSCCLPFANPSLLPPTAWCVLTPEEVAGACFGWALETGALDALGLQAALAEYAAVASAARVPVPLPLQRLWLDLLLLVYPPAGPHQPHCSHFIRYIASNPTSLTATTTPSGLTEQLHTPPPLQPHILAAYLYCQWDAVDPSLADHLEGMLARFCATTPLPAPLLRMLRATQGRGAEGNWDELCGGVWEEDDLLWEEQGASPIKRPPATVAAAHKLAHAAWNGSLGLRANSAAVSARAQRARQQQQQALRGSQGSSSGAAVGARGSAVYSAATLPGGATPPPPPPTTTTTTTTAPSAPTAAAPSAAATDAQLGSDGAHPSSHIHAQPSAPHAAPTLMHRGAPVPQPGLPHPASTPTTAAAATADTRAAQEAAALVHALLKGGHITRAARAARDLLHFLRPTHPQGGGGTATSNTSSGSGGGVMSAILAGVQQQHHHHHASTSSAAPINTARTTSNELISPPTTTTAARLAASYGTEGAGVSETAANAAQALWMALPLEVLAAAAHTGNTVLAAAVHRCFAPYLVATFPSWESVEFSMGLFS